MGSEVSPVSAPSARDATVLDLTENGAGPTKGPHCASTLVDLTGKSYRGDDSAPADHRNAQFL